MKSVDKLFLTDTEQKELIQKISALCGLKQDIIKQVWQYTFFSIYLSLLEDKDKSFNIFSLPYIGKVMIRSNKENTKELDNFLILNDQFKTMIKDIRNGNETGLIQFFKENFINKVIDNIVDNES